VGIFALGRPQVVLLVPIIAAWLWVNGIRGARLRRSSALLVAAAAIVVAPWLIRNAIVLERPVFISTNGGVTFWNGNNPFTTGSAHDVYADRLADFRGIDRDPSLPEVYQHPEPYPFPLELETRLVAIPELELDRAAYRAGLDYIFTNPDDWLKLEAQKLLSFWWFRPNLGANPIYRDHWTLPYQILYPLVLVPAVLGLTLSWRRAGGWSMAVRGFGMIYAVLLLYTCTHVLYNVLTRYRWEIELLLLIFAVMAADACWQALSRRWKPS
jgi:hypothetical protein